MAAADLDEARGAPSPRVARGRAVVIALVGALAMGAMAGTADVRAIVDEALRDAPLRPSLHAGQGGGFFVGSSGGAFRLRIGGYTQFRFIGNVRGDASPDGYTGGFAIRRTRLTFSGHAIDDTIGYKVTHSFSRRAGRSSLSDGYVQKDLGDGWSVRAGQFKLPFLREELHSAKRLLAVQRSLSRGVFSLRRSQGVMLSRRADRARYDVAISNGGDSANEGFGNDATDFALTARGRWLVNGGGTFKHGTRGGAARGAGFSWLLSGAAHYEFNNTPTPETPDERVVQWTADTQVNFDAGGDGWVFMAAYVGREDSSALTGRSAQDHAYLLQGAARLVSDIEPFVRFEAIVPDDDRAGSDELRSFTFGANWYIRGDAMKLSADVVWLLDGTDGNDLVRSDPGAGMLRSSEGDQLVFRVQAQLVF